MAKGSPFRGGGGAGDVSLNMTPMIDCVFQLIIFFVLATQAASAALSKVELARPHKSQSIPSEEVESPNRVIINVVSKDPEGKSADMMEAAEADRYEVMKERIEVGDVEKLVEIIQRRKAEAVEAGSITEKNMEEEFFIEIRADKRVNYQYVAPVIKAGVEAGIRKMNLTALPD